MRVLRFLLPASLAVGALAAILMPVRGIVHDTQHRPIVGAHVLLQAVRSQWQATATTDANGAFAFTRVPVGDYVVIASQPGFGPARVELTVTSETVPLLHLELSVASQSQTTTVTATSATASTESATPTTLLDHADVTGTPGADRTNSLALITDFVPGAYMVHDQLHVRGGHQVNWEVDGVPVPNTNIASNVGPQFDPKDVDYMEAQRGSYAADTGDRTYGVFNVVPRTGFDFNRQAELTVSAGNWGQTNDALSFGNHTEKFAYYASLNGNASQLGLETPVGEVLHDRDAGASAFTSLIYNLDAQNQLRLAASVRGDDYQIPNTPAQQTAGIDDAQHESDAFANFSWVRTLSPNAVLTLSPFYHFNAANYLGGSGDFPLATTDRRSSNYGGAQATLTATVVTGWGTHTLEGGFYGFGQHDDQTFGLRFNDGSGANFTDQEALGGNLEEEFVEDSYKPFTALTLDAGLRLSRFAGSINETAASPRLGAALRLPWFGLAIRGFWGKTYQPPPLLTASGPLLQFVTSQALGFIPLRGERDTEWQAGITAPVRGWTVDADAFHTAAQNFFDHNNVGNSDIFFPLTIAGARVIGFEGTLRSPRLWGRGSAHVAYSNQIAEGEGTINGGLTDFSPPAGYFLLDHDQRNTLNAGFDLALPRQFNLGSNLYYGSGFANGDPGPAHLPGHASLDLSLSKALRQDLTVGLTALNVANRHLLIDNSLTFGGTHYDDPREIYAEVSYRFRY